jgi:hypothetical protein
VAQLADDLSNVLDHLGIDSAAVLGYSQDGEKLEDTPRRFCSACSARGESGGPK